MFEQPQYGRVIFQKLFSSENFGPNPSLDERGEGVIHKRLRNPLPQSFSFPLETELLSNVIRIKTNLLASEKRYNGGYFYQLGPTCGIWSIMNGLLAIGIDMTKKDVEAYVSELVMYAYGHSLQSGEDEIGLRTQYAAEVLDEKYSTIPARITPLSSHNQLLPLPRYASHNISSYLSARRIATKESIMTRNGSIVKTAIDEGKALKVLVFGSYHEATELITHGITIVGYAISEEGYVTAQIADSTRGIFDVPFEYILHHALVGDTYELAKSDFQKNDRIDP